MKAFVVCTHCQGTGSIELTGVYAETLTLLIRHPGKNGPLDGEVQRLALNIPPGTLPEFAKRMRRGWYVYQAREFPQSDEVELWFVQVVGAR